VFKEARDARDPGEVHSGVLEFLHRQHLSTRVVMTTAALSTALVTQERSAWLRGQLEAEADLDTDNPDSWSLLGQSLSELLWQGLGDGDDEFAKALRDAESMPQSSKVVFKRLLDRWNPDDFASGPIDWERVRLVCGAMRVMLQRPADHQPNPAYLTMADQVRRLIYGARQDPDVSIALFALVVVTHLAPRLETERVARRLIRAHDDEVKKWLQSRRQSS
jgi:hypothetical protein